MVFLFVKIGTLFSLPNFGSLDYSLHVVQMRPLPGGHVYSAQRTHVLRPEDRPYTHPSLTDANGLLKNLQASLADRNPSLIENDASILYHLYTLLADNVGTMHPKEIGCRQDGFHFSQRAKAQNRFLPIVAMDFHVIVITFYVINAIKIQADDAVFGLDINMSRLCFRGLTRQTLKCFMGRCQKHMIGIG